MKISPILYNKKINFKAGKTKIYSDFDGTYFPFHQNILRAQNTNPELIRMQSMQTRVSDFLQNKRNKIGFVITTGRSKAEMQHLLNNINRNKLFFFAPDYFIFRDGSEKCDIENEDENLVLKKSNDTTSFMPKNELRDKIIELIKEVDPDITIFEDKINKIKEDYQEESLESELIRKTQKSIPYYASINIEDNSLVEIIFPKKMNKVKEIVDRINKWINENNIPLITTAKIEDNNYFVPNTIDENGNYICEQGHSIILSPKINNSKKDKLAEPKELVKGIIEEKSNDLVIVAGDGSNDESMLNPLNYIDLFGIKIDKSKSISELLEDKEVIEALKKLPLIPIIAGKSKALTHIIEMKKILDKKGIKIIQHAINPETELIGKIKRAMHEYSDRNNEYKFGLGIKLYMEIMG